MGRLLRNGAQGVFCSCSIARAAFAVIQACYSHFLRQIKEMQDNFAQVPRFDAEFEMTSRLLTSKYSENQNRRLP